MKHSTLSDWLHFWLSLVVLVGGGCLAVLRADLAPGVFGFMGSVIGFWFGKRNGNGNGHGNGHENGGIR